MQQYKDKVNAASVVVPGLPQYVPGINIDGDELRDFAQGPRIRGPFMCQLCDAAFLCDQDFALLRMVTKVY